MTEQSGYVQPRSLTDLLEVLAEAGAGAKLLAGGTDVMVAARAGKTWPVVVNLTRVEALRAIDLRAGTLTLGSGVTVTRLLRSVEVKENAPLVWQAADRFASPLVRSRATVGGNLCNASPAADLSLALLASDAEVELESREGSRVLSVDKFVLGPGRTALQPGELVTAVRIPVRAPDRHHRFEKSGARPALEISVAAVAVAFDLVRGKVVEPRICAGAVAPIPLRCHNAEAAVAGKDLGPASIDAAAIAAAREVRPIDDLRGTAVYRRRLVAAFVRRALSAALPGGARSLDARAR
jgi:CO/xanthine dehydrogenase FAD-binding subunit